MTRTILALCLLLAGCAARGERLPGCAGPRWPANPDGSVLSPGAPLPQLSALGATPDCRSRA